MPCYGIGEVSTDPAYRGQGLARTCMDDALARIDAGPAKLSSLSAAAGVEKFYASFGYVAFPIRYTKLSIPLAASPAAPLAAFSAVGSPESGESAMARRIRMLAGSVSAAASSLSSAAASALGVGSAVPLAAPGAASGSLSTPPSPPQAQYQLELSNTPLQIRKIDISAYAFELSMLYDAYNVGLVGPIARSHAYWRQYVPHALKAGLWGAFAANPDAAANKDSGEAPFTTLVAYVGVAEKRGTVKVAEYVAAKAWRTNATLFRVLTQIACVENPAVLALGSAGDAGTAATLSVSVEVPMAPLTRLEGFTATPDEKLTDDSWMYRVRPGLETEPAATPGQGQRRPRGLQPWDVLRTVQHAAAANLHVMWFTDGF